MSLSSQKPDPTGADKKSSVRPASAHRSLTFFTEQLPSAHGGQKKWLNLSTKPVTLPLIICRAPEPSGVAITSIRASLALAQLGAVKCEPPDTPQLTAAQQFRVLVLDIGVRC